MGILDQLRKERALFAECPSCHEEFRLSQARLFDATKRLPPYAEECLAAQNEELNQEWAGLRADRSGARERPRIAAESVGIGKVLEKLAPSLPGFPATPGDCRSLFEPIDYIVFNGLSAGGRVESLTFVDVKSGEARLTPGQAQIRGLVECGKIRLIIEEHRRGFL